MKMIDVSENREVALTDKQIKKLKRAELLEMLIRETRKAEALEQELAEANAKLESRRIDIENRG